MEKLTTGMSGAETIFLYLGILLFVVLITLLIIFVVQKREIKSLLIFFLIPILMIGWPTISSFKLSADGIELSKKGIQEAIDNPVKKEQLAELTDSLNKQHITNPDSLKLLAQANALLGDTLLAARNVEQVLEKEPNNTEALKLKRIYFTPNVVIQKGIEDVKANPADVKAKQDLSAALKKEENKIGSHQVDPLNMAAANLLLKDTITSNKYLEAAVIANPELQNVSNAKRIMKARYSVKKK